jgi:hypothetical protein
MNFLPFVFDVTMVSIIVFVMVTQVVLPLWFGVPLFWTFRKRGRQIADAKFRSLFRNK